MTRRRGVLFLILAAGFALTSTLFITLSLGGLRNTIWFGRIMDRIERDGPTEDNLRDAASYARTSIQWRRLLQIAWRLPEDRRWKNTAELGALAAERFPRDDTWTLISSYAHIRQGRHDEATRLLGSPDEASDVRQMIHILAVLDPDRMNGSEERLITLASDIPDGRLTAAIGEALRDGDARSLQRAGDETGIQAFYLNAAIVAATFGDRDSALSAVASLRAQPTDAVMIDPLATAYIARWLQEPEWFFRILSTMDGRRAVTPEILLMHADFLIDQRQLVEAERIYAELRRLHPAVSTVPWLNGGAIRRTAESSGTAVDFSSTTEQIYRTGRELFPTDLHLSLEYGVWLIASGRRLAAVSVLAPSLYRSFSTGFDTDTVSQRQWLLVRTILGSRAPVERLSGDLWHYVNAYPDAELVVRFLARFLLVRNDTSGIANILRRYPPEYAPWAAAFHGVNAARREDLTQAGRLFAMAAEQTRGGIHFGPSDFDDLYNLALFALRHRTLPEAANEITRLRTAAERTGNSELIGRSILLEAERLRLVGDTSNARALAESVLPLIPYDDTVYTYATILAPLP